ncbi:hypothetical protein VPH35_060305 [Triticum aestivum]
MYCSTVVQQLIPCSSVCTGMRFGVSPRAARGCAGVQFVHGCFFKLNETASCASWGFDVCAALTMQYSDEHMSLAVRQTCECSMTCNFWGGCIFLLILLCHAMCGCWTCLFSRYYCLCLEVRFIILKRFILKKEKDS